MHARVGARQNARHGGATHALVVGPGTPAVAGPGMPLAAAPVMLQAIIVFAAVRGEGAEAHGMMIHRAEEAN